MARIEREIPYAAFTAGTLATPTNNTYIALQVIAGRRGCRFFVDIQTIVTTGTGLNEICLKTYATEALANAALTMGALGAGQANPTSHSFTSNAATSRIRVGATATNIGGSADLPRSVTRSLDVSANGFFHVGNARMHPAIYLAPFHVAHFQSVEQYQTGTYENHWYIGVEVEEEYHRNGMGL